MEVFQTDISGSENKELIVFKINKNKLTEIEKMKVNLKDDHSIRQIIKLKNNSVVVIGNTELYLYNLINN